MFPTCSSLPFLLQVCWSRLLSPHLLPFKQNYLFSAMPGLHCCSGFSLLQQAGTALHLQYAGFLPWCLLLRRTGVSSCSTWAQQLQLPDSVVTAHGLSWSEACGIFPDQGLNLSLLCWQADSLPLSHQESPQQLPFY